MNTSFNFTDTNYMSDVNNLFSNGIFSARLEGIISAIIPAGQTVTLNWTVPYSRVVSGADYEAINRNMGDRISLQVAHPVVGVVDEFAKRLFVRTEYRKELYGAALVAGLMVRVVYENVGANDVTFNLNLDLHERVV